MQFFHDMNLTQKVIEGHFYLDIGIYLVLL